MILGGPVGVREILVSCRGGGGGRRKNDEFPTRPDPPGVKGR